MWNISAVISDNLKNCQTYFVYNKKWNAERLRHLPKPTKKKVEHHLLNVLGLPVLASELKE